MMLDAATLMDFPIPQSRQTVNAKDAILYALSTGYGLEALDSAHLAYTQENGLVTAATLANVVAHPGPWMKTAGVDWQRLVHSEQRLTIHRPVPLETSLISTSRVIAVVDRGAENGMFATFERHIAIESDGSPVATIIQTNACRGDGGCGSAGTAPEPLAPLPNRPADKAMAIALRGDAALLYRLNGDLNPLHSDPAYAAKAGFARPILHGLCTFGHAGYAIGRLCADMGAGTGITGLSQIAARFSAPVMPGEDILFELWHETDGALRFRALVPARNITILDRGTARLV